jgi:hypothetical protein
MEAWPTLRHLLILPVAVSYRRYSSEDVDEHQSYSAVTARLTGQFYDKDYVFVKDMAYCVKGRCVIYIYAGSQASSLCILLENPRRYDVPPTPQVSHVCPRRGPRVI